jgi:hypothetical protein
MDNDFNVDVTEIAASVRTSELIVLRFVTIGERLLLDFRSNDVDGPLVRVVQPVKSVEERFAELQQLRPRFGRPEKVIVIWWPRFARSLAETEIWPAVMERISDAGHAAAVRCADEALAELVALERQTQRNAVLGEGFRTLWSASPSRR